MDHEDVLTAFFGPLGFGALVSDVLSARLVVLFALIVAVFFFGFVVSSDDAERGVNAESLCGPPPPVPLVSCVVSDAAGDTTSSAALLGPPPPVPLVSLVVSVEVGLFELGDGHPVVTEKIAITAMIAIQGKCFLMINDCE